MEAYKRGSHTVWDCKYHVVWVTKYRYPVLGGDVGMRCRELLRERARAHEMVVHARSINRDQHLWARGYWVVSSGNVTDEMWVDYIKNQAPPEPDDDFKVT
jgi:putative transposase